MTKIVMCDITKKEMLMGRLGHYVKADFIIQDEENDMTDILSKTLHVTEDMSMSYVDIDQLSNDVLVAYLETLQTNQGV